MNNDSIISCRWKERFERERWLAKKCDADTKVTTHDVNCRLSPTSSSRFQILKVPNQSDKLLEGQGWWELWNVQSLCAPAVLHGFTSPMVVLNRWVMVPRNARHSLRYQKVDITPLLKVICPSEPLYKFCGSNLFEAIPTRLPSSLKPTIQQNLRIRLRICLLCLLPKFGLVGVLCYETSYIAHINLSQ